MTSPDDLLRFIGSSFRSVWALEVLLVLKREPRQWTHAELVSTMRASELVVSRALDALLAAGLVSIEGEGARYMPVNASVAECVEQVEKLYGYQFRVRGKAVTANDIDRILRESRNPTERLAVWEASKAVGPVLKPGMIRLRALRNQVVQALGYPDFFNIAGTINNQTGQAVEVVAITMGVYLTLSLITSYFMNWYNARMALVER